MQTWIKDKIAIGDRIDRDGDVELEIETSQGVTDLMWINKDDAVVIIETLKNLFGV